MSATLPPGRTEGDPLRNCLTDKIILRYCSAMKTPRRAPTRKGMIVRTIALDTEMHRRLTLAGLDERCTVNELLRRIVRAWFAQRDTTHPQPRRAKT